MCSSTHACAFIIHSQHSFIQSNKHPDLCLHPTIYPHKYSSVPMYLSIQPFQCIHPCAPTIHLYIHLITQIPTHPYTRAHVFIDLCTLTCLSIQSPTRMQQCSHPLTPMHSSIPPHPFIHLFTHVAATLSI